MPTNDNFGTLTTPPSRWSGVLTTGDTVELLAHAYGMEDERYVFSFLLKGKPHFEVTTLSMPVGLNEDEQWETLSVGELLPTDGNDPCSLALPIEHWSATLTTGDTLEVLAHEYAVKDERGVFSVLFKGQPNFMVALLSIPAALVKEVRNANGELQWKK